MNDSQVEELLRQMSLAEPSPALDARITDRLNPPDAQPAAEPAVAAASWAPVVAASVVFLIIGLLVGRSAATNRPTGDSAPPISEKDGAVDESLSGDDPWQPVAHGDMVTTLRDRPESVLQQDRGVPEVAVLCVLSTMPTPGDEESRCLNCHVGIDHARRRFREEHVWHLKQESCHLCHDMTDKRSEPQRERIDANDSASSETQAANSVPPPESSVCRS